MPSKVNLFAIRHQGVPGHWIVVLEAHQQAPMRRPSIARIHEPSSWPQISHRGKSENPPTPFESR
jgi:hypothetical protein